MEQSLGALADAALDFANELRSSHGLETATRLVAGTPGSCCGCPVAVTAGGWEPGKVAGWEISEQAIFVGPRGAVKEVYGRTPDTVKEFMAAFDTGMFPELVAVTA